MSTLRSLCIVMLTLTLASAAALAAPTPPPAGYQVETVGSYNSSGMHFIRGLAVDDNGVVYVSHYGKSGSGNSGNITRVAPGGVTTRWIDGFTGLKGITWGGGTAYGDNIYAVDNSKRIHKVDLDGNVSTFSNLSDVPVGLTIDRNGSYGGNMFCTANGVDRILQISPSGTDTVFSEFPDSMRGGPSEIAVDPGTRYGGLMYLCVDEDYSQIPSPKDGLFWLDSNGNATRYAPTFDYVRTVAFDNIGEMFGGDMFIIAPRSDVTGMHLWRVDELGNAEDFSKVGWGMTEYLAFGPDGAMYLSEYWADKGTTVIYKVSLTLPTPVSIDIKPNNCINPLNVNSKGPISVAILGTEDFDALAVDIATIKLEGVSPARSTFADISSPAADGRDCPKGTDGFADVVLKFDKQEIIAALGDLADVSNKTEILLTLTCKLMDDETDFEGTDFVRIQKPQGPKEK